MVGPSHLHLGESTASSLSRQSAMGVVACARDGRQKSVNLVGIHSCSLTSPRERIFASICGQREYLVIWILHQDLYPYVPSYEVD